MQDYWHKQATSKPLFPDFLWSRPENRSQAGKLLIIGGNQYGFAAPAEAFMTAEKAGVGIARVLLPQAIKKVAGAILPDVNYAVSTPSGSFSQAALGELLEQAAWADGVLFAGDLGRNSETAILIEKFLAKYNGPVTLTKDAADYSLALADLALNRENTLLVATMAQLQKLGTAAHFKTAFTLGMDLLRLVEGLHDFTSAYPVRVVVKHLDRILVAVDGQVSSTLLSNDQPIWRVKTAATAAVWWLQNQVRPFEALTTAVTEP